MVSPQKMGGVPAVETSAGVKPKFCGEDGPFKDAFHAASDVKISGIMSLQLVNDHG